MIPVVLPVATKIAVDLGIGTIVKCGVANITRPYVLGTGQKILVGLGELALTGVACDKANDYVDSTYDMIADFMVNKDLDIKFFTRGGKVDGK